MPIATSTSRKVCALAVLGAAAVLAAICLSACGPTGTQQYEQRLATTQGPAVHAVTEGRIREIMHSLQFDPLPDPDQAIPVAARNEQLKEAAAVAAKMADSAKDIAPLVDKLGLNAQERQIFGSLGDKLAKQSKELNRLLVNGQVNAAQDQAKQLQGTCQACHALFHQTGSVPLTPKK